MHVVFLAVISVIKKISPLTGEYVFHVPCPEQNNLRNEVKLILP
jgi:hypothetical protein